MKIDARAKINLSLDVTGRRADGYHLVKMVMQNVDVYDTLQIEKREEAGIVIETNVPGIPTDQSNLIWKAAHLLMEEFGVAGGLYCHLTKRIPAAAGLAGGSTDAAATMIAVNELYELGLSREELCARGARIGADIPYCIQGGTALSEGIGEILTELPPMPDCYLILAKPEAGVSTQFVYTHLDALASYPHPDVDAQIEALRAGDLQGVVDAIGNVLELVTIPEHPVIAEIKDCLKAHGALGACMSGSGPTVFAIFDQEEVAEQALEALRATGLAKDLFLTKPYQPGGSDDRR